VSRREYLVRVSRLVASNLLHKLANSGPVNNKWDEDVVWREMKLCPPSDGVAIRRDRHGEWWEITAAFDDEE